MVATATLEFDETVPDEVVEGAARFTDATFGGIDALTNARGNRTAIGTIDAQFQSAEKGAGIAGPAGKVTMSGDGRGKVGSNDNEDENTDPDLTDPERQMKILAELMAEMGKADFSMESVLEMLLDDRDIPGLEKPSVRRMQQLIQVLHFYALQQASLNAQNAQYWVRSEMIHRLYQQLKVAATGPNPEAAFRALIKTERAAITELRQQMAQQGLSKVPLSQLTAVVVARQMLPLQQVFQQQLSKLQEMLKQAAQNNTNMKYVQVLQMQIAQLQAAVRMFESPALKPLLDYAKAINAQIAAQNPNGINRNGQQAPQINFSALPKFVMTAATMQALTQTLQVSRAMLRVQSEWAQGVLRMPNAQDARGASQTIRLPDSLRAFWQQQTTMRTMESALRPEPSREIRDQVRQVVQDIAAARVVNPAMSVALHNAMASNSEASRIADVNARMLQLRQVGGKTTDPLATTQAPNINGAKSTLSFAPVAITMYGAPAKMIESPNVQIAAGGRQATHTNIAANSKQSAPSVQLRFPNPSNTVTGTQPLPSGAGRNVNTSNAPIASNHATTPQTSSAPGRDAGAGNGSTARDSNPATIGHGHTEAQTNNRSTETPASSAKAQGAEARAADPAPKADTDPKNADNKQGEKPADPKAAEQAAQQRAAEAEVARLAAQGVKAENTGIGVATVGAGSVAKAREDFENAKAKRDDLVNNVCPVGGKKAQIQQPKSQSPVAEDEETRRRNAAAAVRDTKSAVQTSTPHYNDAAVMHAMTAAKDGKTTKLDNGSKISLKAIAKGICEVCTGCGKCDTAGGVKESIIDKARQLLGIGRREAAAPTQVATLDSEMAAVNASLEGARAAFAATQQAQGFLGRLGRAFSK